MAVVLKSPEELERMRIAGRLASEVLDFITPHVRPGVTTGKLNDLCHEYMVDVQGPCPRRSTTRRRATGRSRSRSAPR